MTESDTLFSEHRITDTTFTSYNKYGSVFEWK